MSNIWDDIPTDPISPKYPPLVYKPQVVRRRGNKPKIREKKTRVLYVVYLDGKWKRAQVSPDYRWDTFSLASSYTLGHAKTAAQNGGVVMERLGTEEETLENGDMK